MIPLVENNLNVLDPEARRILLPMTSVRDIVEHYTQFQNREGRRGHRRSNR